MRNINLHFLKKFFSIITASSMLLSFGYVSAMKPESNSLNLNPLVLEEDSLHLCKVGTYCLSLLERDRMFFKLTDQMFRNFFFKSSEKIKVLMYSKLDENTYKLIHEASKNVSLLKSSVLRFLDVHLLLSQSAQDCFDATSKEIKSDIGIVLPDNIAMRAIMRCNTYSLLQRDLSTNLIVFIYNIEKVAKLASTENLSSDVKNIFSDLQKLINDNAHLLNQIKELCA